MIDLESKALRAGAALVLLAVSSFVAQAQPLYQLESALTIKSPNPPSWDYLAFDAAHDHLFISRDDGILVYDVAAKKIAGAIENTVGANATTLVPEFDRGYVINGVTLLTYSRK